MGKLSDALEKRKQETEIKTKILDIENKPPVPDTQMNIVRDIDPKLVVLASPDSVEAEHFKALRSQILFPKDEKKRRVILVTSVFPGEGKTFVAANIAAGIAQGIDEHVLLIDCDFRRPSLHIILNYPNKVGLHDYLIGEKALPELLIRTNIDKLSLLPAGSPSKNTAELLSSSEMRDFLIEVRERYDDRYIILDSAPIHVTSEVDVLTKYADGVIFVVMNGKTPRETIKKNIRKVDKDKFLGIVFNGYSQDIKKYDKYYKNYYR